MVEKPLEKDGDKTSNERYEQNIDSEFALKIKLINSNANEKYHSFLKKENTKLIQLRKNQNTNQRTAAMPLK